MLSGFQEAANQQRSFAIGREDSRAHFTMDNLALQQYYLSSFSFERKIKHFSPSVNPAYDPTFVFKGSEVFILLRALTVHDIQDFLHNATRYTSQKIAKKFGKVLQAKDARKTPRAPVSA